MSFRNDCAYLNFYKESLKGTIQDYQISFNEEQDTIEKIVPLTLDLFQQLVKSMEGKPPLYARLVVKVKFFHVNYVTSRTEERSYHFSSYKSERVNDVNDFYQRHMEKIAERLQAFNMNGSNLLIKNIEHIHIQCSFVKSSFKQTYFD